MSDKECVILSIIGGVCLIGLCIFFIVMLFQLGLLHIVSLIAFMAPICFIITIFMYMIGGKK